MTDSVRAKALEELDITLEKCLQDSDRLRLSLTAIKISEARETLKGIEGDIRQKN